MKKSLLIVFLLLIVAPIGVISWLGYSSFVQERENTQERYAILARRQLEEIDRLVSSHLEKLELEIQSYGDFEVLSATELRRISRNTGMVDQLFVIDDEHAFVFPPESGEMSSREQRFLTDARQLELPLVLGNVATESPGASTGLWNWYTWFMGDGINFIYWKRLPTGHRVGVMLNRVALLSSIIAMLPDSDFTVSSEYSSRILLTDARGGSLYQWGLFKPSENELPLATIALAPPLAAWHFHLYLDLDNGGALPILRQYVSILSGVFALVVVTILLAVYFYRENRKLITDALQKVSFVNQVSHELKTPLTNIRLYTELLESRLSDAKDLDHLEVISSESRRLSRMISNVLTFSRGGKNGFNVTPADVVIDDIIRSALDSFAPSLRQKSIEVVLRCGAPAVVQTDRDFVEQVLSNLIANAEKYAAGGGYLEIVSSQTASLTTIVVADQGPGIPQRERKNIFKPFYRISNRLSDGVSGAGIGLAISRKLAERMGGSLILDENGPGAVFRFCLPNYIEGAPE